MSYATDTPGPALAGSPVGADVGDDPRWAAVEQRIRQLGARPDALIEVLHVVQERFGMLSLASLARVSEALGVPPSQVIGVATFYRHFTLAASGAHACAVCTGTVCWLRGSYEMLDAVAARFHLAPGGTTPDGSLTVRGARCVGVCAMAPAAVVDGAVVGETGVEELVSRLGAR